VDKEGQASDREAELLRRMVALEREIASLRQEVRTQRLVVVDDAGHERLVAAVVGPAIELRMPLSNSVPGHTTGILLFAIDGSDGLPGGVGVQLWGNGLLVKELTLWEDELPPRTASPRHPE
jgi:hypothetical protein